MSTTANKCSEIADKYTKVHTEAGVVVIGGEWRYKYNGTAIIESNELRLLHFTKNNQTAISNDELKEKMFVWVYDSKNQTIEQRRDYLFIKMKKNFPDANVLVLVIPKSTKSALCIKGHKAFAHFEGYGDSDVITCFF